MPIRKRSLLKPSLVQEVEENYAKRKLVPRQAKKVNFFDVYGSKDDAKKREDNRSAKENGIWLVTCENKEGNMDIDKLERGEDCIECQGLWFTPSAFEEFAGKGACKKWKGSIYHEGRPLTYWFAKGVLSTTGYLRRGIEPMMNIKVSPGKRGRKSTKSVSKFGGITSSKYKRLSTSETQINTSSGGCIPTEKAEIKSIEDPYRSGSKGGDKHSDSNAQILKTDQENDDGLGDRNNGHSINAGDAEDEKQDDVPNQSKTDDGGVPAAADYPKDHNTTKERHQDVDIAEAEKHEYMMKTKVIVKRLSLAMTTFKTIEHPNEDSLCEPVEEITPSEKTEDHPAVSEAVSEGDVKDDLSTSPAQFDTSNTTGLSAAPLNLLLRCDYKNDMDEAKPEHDKAELETSGTCIQVSDCLYASNMVGAHASGGSEGFDVDELDLGQLKREKIKMQLKVLKLQEKYYTSMLNDLKK